MFDRSSERHAAFRVVEKTYKNISMALESNEQLEYRSTDSGMWAVSDPEDVYRAFCYFHLDRYEHMADLGSGDGRVSLIGSLFTQTTGYETDEVLHRKSVEIRDRLRIENAIFLQEDYLIADLSPYNMLYLYPDKPFTVLEEKLRAAWQGHLLVYGPHFPPNHLKKVAESPPEVGKFMLYRAG